MRTNPVVKPMFRPSGNSNRPPFWLALSLAAALGLLLYGAVFVKSPPSAFDSPEAQSPNRAVAPWATARPL